MKGMNGQTINTYGSIETNHLDQADHQALLDKQEEFYVDWTEPGLYVTRLRLLSDPGFPYWDVSYCYGEIRIKGQPTRYVRVHLPFFAIPKGKVSRFIVEHAKRDGVYAKGIGILDNISTLQ